MGIVGVGGSNRHDHTGKVFGRWAVLGIAQRGTRTKRVTWLCQCACGVMRAIPSNSLVTGASSSCGCFNKEQTSKRFIKHGKRKTREYGTWAAMIGRCTNPNNQDFKHYGGRGIQVCDRWKEFANFFSDMGVRPVGMELDRIDNSGNYSPDNCRWTTHKENSRNTRKCRIIELNGLAYPVSVWAENLGISSSCILGRLKRGQSVKDALLA